MGMQFNGRAFAQQILSDVDNVVAQRQQSALLPVTLHSIFPYEDEASVLYTKLKQRDAEAHGIRYTTQALSIGDPVETWVRAVVGANKNSAIHGVLVQKPTSAQFQEFTGGTQSDFDAWWGRVSETIAPEKDVDGLGPEQLASVERHAQQVLARMRPPEATVRNILLPATAAAVIEILFSLAGSIEILRSKNVAVIGRSQIVGRPTAAGLSILGVENRLISSQEDLSVVLPEFDVIVSATGKQNLVGAECIKQNAWLVDVGAPHAEFTGEAQQKAEWFTPVPGGVGPVTRACLLQSAARLAGEN